MRIAVLGGGPAGLYFSLLMKQANPACDITTFDRNAADNTFGWGIVFSDKTMDGFREADEKVVNEIEANFRHWDDVDVFFKDRKITSSGHGFCGIARLKLQEIRDRVGTKWDVLWLPRPSGRRKLSPMDRDLATSPGRGEERLGRTHGLEDSRQ